MVGTNVERDAEAFFGKWAEAWPATRLARLFASDAEWPMLRARIGVLFEVAETCWVLRDATVREHKLAWWLEELGLHERGHARHPLLQAAPMLRLSAGVVESALLALNEAAPANAAEALSRIQRLSSDPDEPVASAAMQALSAAMFLLALRAGQPSAFAQAPLDLRARHAVASAESGVAMNALVATMARQWREELRSRFRSFARTDFQGQRGLRVLQHEAVGVVDALAGGRDVPELNWRSTLSAWWAVAGLR
jgi:hypothetical protein